MQPTISDVAVMPSCGARQHERQLAQHRQRSLTPSVASGGGFLQLALANRHEGELGGHEVAVGQDQRQDGQQAKAMVIGVGGKNGPGCGRQSSLVRGMCN